jgi:glycine cleavage system transcriptional repressor
VAAGTHHRRGLTVRQFKILFLVGTDRPGIVDKLSGFLFERGANIEDSRMAAMGGCFSIMTLFSCETEQLEAITAALGEMERLGFETWLHDAQDPSTVVKTPELPLHVEVLAMDHPGIVQKVVHILHRHSVNIQSLNTQVIRAPHTGAPLFDLNLVAGVPPETSVTRVKEELEALAYDMNLDLSFKK